ncbi:hypothetical protein BKA70DRAFT_1232378 [Coprinopsis sp. MPI-PUGE-AT-0042]|nr:hypothetical protein BKA70DRAFT_1232378 [Coprinopsis sp. MPI-PUGE-AT-0042]
MQFLTNINPYFPLVPRASSCPPSKKTASSARAGANPPSAGKDTAPSAAPKLNDKVTTPLRSSSRIRKPSAKQQALLDAALASDSDDAEIAQGVFIGARKDKAAANKAALEEFPPLPKRLLSRTDPAVHPASLRRSVTPEDARSQRPLPRRKRQDKTSSSPRKANTKVSQDVISLHDTDSEMGEAIDPDANARSLLDVEAQESGSEANGSDDETNLEGVFEETEEDRLFIDDRSDGDLSLHGSSSADEKPIVDRKGKRVLRDSMSPEQVPTSKKARKQVAALPAPTSSGGSRPQIKELPNKSTITRKTPIDTVRSGARRATPSAAADREKDDDEYYAAYGPPLKNNGPYVSSKPSPALLASPIASSSRRSMAVPSTSSSPIKRDRCRQDASSGRSAWNNSPSTSVVDIDDETLPQSPRSNRADKPASRQVTSSKTEERDQSRSERSGPPFQVEQIILLPRLLSVALLGVPRNLHRFKLESPPPVINDDAHLGPKDNPWLSDFYATLPSIPEVVFEKTAKNRLERSDDHILSPARMKDALLELPHGKAYVKRLRYLLTMMSYKTIVNPVTPSRQLSNNACFLATGQTVYCYPRNNPRSQSSYSALSAHSSALHDRDCKRSRAV